MFNKIQFKKEKNNENNEFYMYGLKQSKQIYENYFIIQQLMIQILLFLEDEFL